MTPVHLRPLAEDDLAARTRYYREEGGDQLGSRFFDAAVTTLRSIEQMPGVGTPEIGERCKVPGLRVRRIVGFSCGWFYFVAEQHVDVVRLLADAQDLSSLLAVFADESSDLGETL